MEKSNSLTHSTDVIKPKFWFYCANSAKKTDRYIDLLLNGERLPLGG